MQQASRLGFVGFNPFGETAAAAAAVSVVGFIFLILSSSSSEARGRGPQHDLLRRAGGLQLSGKGSRYRVQRCTHDDVACGAHTAGT